MTDVNGNMDENDVSDIYDGPGVAFEPEIPRADLPAPRPPLLKEKVFHVPVWAWIACVVLAGSVPFGMSVLAPPPRPASQAFDLAPTPEPVSPSVAPIAQPRDGSAPLHIRDDSQVVRDPASPPGVTFAEEPALDALRATDPGIPAGVGSALLNPPVQVEGARVQGVTDFQEPRLAPPEGAQPVLLAAPNTGEMEILLEQIKQVVSDLREQQSGLTSRIEALGERIDKIQSHMETTDKAVRNTWWVVHKTLGPQYEEIKARESASQAKPAAQAAPQRPSGTREEATAQSVKERAERLKQSVLESKRRAALVGWSVAGIGQGFAALRAPDGKDYVVRPGDRLGDAVVERIDGRAVVTSFGEIR